MGFQGVGLASRQHSSSKTSIYAHTKACDASHIRPGHRKFMLWGCSGDSPASPGKVGGFGVEDLELKYRSGE